MTNSNNFAFASALSTRDDTLAAVDEVCQQALQNFAGAPDLAFVFFSAEHVPQAERLATELRRRLNTENILGCSGESIVGVRREVENAPAVSLWLARLPGVTLLPMHLEFARTSEGGSLLGWHDDTPAKWPMDAALITVGDPYSFPADWLLERLNDEQPGAAVVGGMASTASQPGENRLIVGDRVVNHGAVAVLMHGAVRVRTLVSQGCRPIGQPYIVTRAERNVIYELGGAPAYQRLVELFQTLATREQEQVRRGLHVGRVVSEYLERFEQGDFLVRNVVGMDVNAGAIAIGDFVRTGQTVQFHVRDWETADGELRNLLAAAKQSSTDSPRGALLFTCNGRGMRLFPEPNHDAQVIGEAFEDMPLAGFFAAGELGPIGGKNFMHGFTASAALIEPMSALRR